mmetsp:Transcript_18815/g.52461  ORF Transcript_18815/g.52461 Transcript_18815/m.52461 type:complete len:1370 (-) Transcript_18815:950-5059(-)
MDSWNLWGEADQIDGDRHSTFSPRRGAYYSPRAYSAPAGTDQAFSASWGLSDHGTQSKLSPYDQWPHGSGHATVPQHQHQQEPISQQTVNQPSTPNHGSIAQYGPMHESFHPSEAGSPRLLHTPLHLQGNNADAITLYGCYGGHAHHPQHQRSSPQQHAGSNPASPNKSPQREARIQEGVPPESRGSRLGSWMSNPPTGGIVQNPTLFPSDGSDIWNEQHTAGKSDAPFSPQFQQQQQQNPMNQQQQRRSARILWQDGSAPLETDLQSLTIQNPAGQGELSPLSQGYATPQKTPSSSHSGSVSPPLGGWPSAYRPGSPCQSPSAHRIGGNGLLHPASPASCKEVSSPTTLPLHRIRAARLGNKASAMEVVVERWSPCPEYGSDGSGGGSSYERRGGECRGDQGRGGRGSGGRGAARLGARELGLHGRGHPSPRGGRGRGGRGAGAVYAGQGPHELRNLWQQVCQVSKGQKLDDGNGNGVSALTVEKMLKIVCSLPPGRSVVEELAPAFTGLDSRAAAALLKEVAKAGHPGRAVELFDWLRSQEDDSDLTYLCDVFTYTTMISLCTSRQHLRRAMELVAEMHTRGIPCNVHTYSALMNVCIKCNELELALDVYKEMQDEGCVPSLVTYNILIDMYGKAGRFEDALKILDTMEKNSIDPEVRTYNSIISACSSAGQPTAGLEVYERLVKAGKTPTATTFTALISAYGKAGQLDRAMDMFQEMVVHGCQRNVITFSSLISACEKAGCWELALKMLGDMQKEGCAPNVVTYNSLIMACAQGCQWKKANELFDQMQAEGCHPDSVTYSALISAYEKGGQWHRALQVYEQLQSDNRHGSERCNSHSAPRNNALHNTAVHNTIVDVLWQTGLVCAQAKALQVYRKAFRNGHFRLTKRTQGDTDVHEVNVPPFSIGAAVISVHRWLLELSAQLSSTGSFPKAKVGFTVWRGKHGREARHSMVKAAVMVALAGVQPHLKESYGSPSNSEASSPRSSPGSRTGPPSPSSVPILVADTPFMIVQDSPQCLRLEARSHELAQWLQSDVFTQRRIAFITEEVAALAGPAAAALGGGAVAGRQGRGGRGSRGPCPGSPCGLGLPRGGGQPPSPEDTISEATWEYERQVEMRCKKAFEAIRDCESTLQLPSQHCQWLLARGSVLAMVKAAAEDLGFEEESLHDSVLIADRAVAAGMMVPSGHAGLVLVGGALQVIAAKAAMATPHNMPPLAAAANGLVAHIEMAGSLAPGSCLELSARLSSILGGDLRAISALRCLKLYLERLGYEGYAAIKAGHKALSILHSSLGMPELLAFVPSQIAAAALYWDRTTFGAVPLWPNALANLTGYSDPGEPTFAAATTVIAAVASMRDAPGSSSPVSTLHPVA